MKILHYSLGFPPYRTGGLVRYTLDLINEQVKQGDDVVYLYPGFINPFKKTSIVEDKINQNRNFRSFSIINSLPLPLFGGISEPDKFMTHVNENLYLKFLKLIKPDVIHVHTLMGIHEEFFRSAKLLNIRIVFTTHDYFGIGPEPTLFFNGDNYDGNNNLNKWLEISETAMPVWKLKLFQTSFYPSLKAIIKKFKKNRNYEPKEVGKYNSIHDEIDSCTREKFVELMEYYKQIFKLIDVFHFNSTQTQKIYLASLKIDHYKCITITNSRVSDNNYHLKKERSDDKINIGYFGPYANYKGFNDFINLAKSLKEKKYNYFIFGSDDHVNLPHFIHNGGRFNGDELENIMGKMDVAIVPSKWRETFGFITIEALSYGVKVILSKTVGSKDLVPDSFVFDNIKEVPDMLQRLSKYVVTRQKNMGQHYYEIKDLYTMK